MKKAPILLGSVVVSKAGRDEGRTFLVVESLDEEYVLISDGNTHKMGKPKKKKRRHLKQVSEPRQEIVLRLTDGQPVFDHEVRRWLSHEEE
ncbi:MAG: RNA-binding protein [Clostridia bacterium]|nr:RNA-binding protein [Clostridia bacterium]